MFIFKNFLVLIILFVFSTISFNINSATSNNKKDKLKEIKDRLKRSNVSYNEIACVMATIK